MQQKMEHRRYATDWLLDKGTTAVLDTNAFNLECSDPFVNPNFVKSERNFKALLKRGIAEELHSVQVTIVEIFVKHEWPIELNLFRFVCKILYSYNLNSAKHHREKYRL